MNDETWMRELARAARDEAEAERSGLDGRWDRLSAGELPAAEVEELRRRGESSEGAREAYEAFRPLGPEFKAQALAAVRARLKAGQAPPREAIPFAPRPERLELPTRRPRARRWAPWGVAAAAAAALVLFLRLPGGRQGPLPPYDADLSGGVVSHRGAGDPAGLSAWTFRQGSRLDLVLRPRTAVEGEVAAGCALLRGGEARSCDANLRVVAGGAIQVAGTIGEDLRLEPGEWRLCAAVGRPGDLPAGAALCPDASGETEEGRAGRWRFDLSIE